MTAFVYTNFYFPPDRLMYVKTLNSLLSILLRIVNFDEASLCLQGVQKIKNFELQLNFKRLLARRQL